MLARLIHNASLVIAWAAIIPMSSNAQESNLTEQSDNLHGILTSTDIHFAVREDKLRIALNSPWDQQQIAVEALTRAIHSGALDQSEVKKFSARALQVIEFYSGPVSPDDNRRLNELILSVAQASALTNVSDEIMMHLAADDRWQFSLDTLNAYGNNMLNRSPRVSSSVMLWYLIRSDAQAHNEWLARMTGEGISSAGRMQLAAVILASKLELPMILNGLKAVRTRLIEADEPGLDKRLQTLSLIEQAAHRYTGQPDAFVMNEGEGPVVAAALTIRQCQWSLDRVVELVRAQELTEANILGVVVSQPHE